MHRRFFSFLLALAGLLILLLFRYLDSKFETHSIFINCPTEDVLFRKPVHASDRCLLKLLRDKYVHQPSERTVRYQLEKPIRLDHPIIPVVQKYLPKKALKSGFFVDCGAHDGEFNSNTIFLEKKMGWTGVLIEPTKDTFRILQSKRRKAWLANLCLSTNRYAQKLPFYESKINTSWINGLDDRSDVMGPMESSEIVTCVPLESVLLSLNVSTVNFFSLDIEGKELDVLKAIPFDLITIQIIQVEHWWVPGGDKAVKEFLEPKGFRFLKIIQEQSTLDSVFVHRSLVI